jgi:homoserine kinase
MGPGFDVIGLALSMYLELHVTIDESASSGLPLNCKIAYEGCDAEGISLDPEVNLITRVALYVLRCHDQRIFPVETHIHVKNPIPLGRGLGSSGTAVVAGVVLANEVAKLGLSRARILDYCLMVGLGRQLLFPIRFNKVNRQNDIQIILRRRCMVD